jgi:glycosyltransferase involved in cell wall biosynthesis
VSGTGRDVKLDVLAHGDGPFDYEPAMRAAGADVLRCSDRLRSWGYGRTVTDALKRGGPFDIVHTHVQQFGGRIFSIARRAGVRTLVAHFHNDPSTTPASQLTRLYWSWVGNGIHRHANAGLAVSTQVATAAFGRDWQRDPRWRVFSAAVDFSGYRALPEPNVRRELGLKDGPVVGTVGRLSTDKNHAFFVDVAEELARRTPSVKEVVS